jgi:hypothetical protein
MEMANRKSEKTSKTCPRQSKLRALRKKGSAAWRKEATQNLQEFGRDEDGIAHLANAIKAVLRADKWKR